MTALGWEEVRLPLPPTTDELRAAYARSGDSSEDLTMWLATDAPSPKGRTSDEVRACALQVFPILARARRQDMIGKGGLVVKGDRITRAQLVQRLDSPRPIIDKAIQYLVEVGALRHETTGERLLLNFKYVAEPVCRCPHPVVREVRCYMPQLHEGPHKVIGSTGSTQVIGEFY